MTCDCELGEDTCPEAMKLLRDLTVAHNNRRSATNSESVLASWMEYAQARVAWEAHMGLNGHQMAQ